MTAVDAFPFPEVHGMLPADNGEAITPSDTVDLAKVSRGIYVGVAGNVTVIMKGGATLTFTGVQAGSLIPIRVTRVKATLTTATNMVAIY